jgi:hypothetical protein
MSAPPLMVLSPQVFGRNKKAVMPMQIGILLAGNTLA